MSAFSSSIFLSMYKRYILNAAGCAYMCICLKICHSNELLEAINLKGNKGYGRDFREEKGVMMHLYFN